MTKEEFKEYYLDHKENWKQYRENQKDYQREYHKQYRYKSKNIGLFIYFIFDESGKLVYIGKTNNIVERMRNHKHSQGKWKVGEKVLYKEFKGITYEELYDIEQHLIEVLKPVRNDKNTDYDADVIKYINRDFNLKEFEM